MQVTLKLQFIKPHHSQVGYLYYYTSLRDGREQVLIIKRISYECGGV